MQAKLQQKKEKRAKIIGQRPKGRNKKEYDKVQISKEWTYREPSCGLSALALTEHEANGDLLLIETSSLF